MLSEAEIAALADRVLGDALAPVGFVSADVRAGADLDGEAALFLIAHFRAGSSVAIGHDSLDAGVALRNALIERGDNRFPYLVLAYEDDDAAAERMPS